MRGRALPLAALAALAASGPSAPAHAEVDFTPLVVRLDAMTANASLPKKTRAACTALKRKLAAPDRPGLGDDFAKLGAVAAALRGGVADAQLTGSMEAALEEAFVAGAEDVAGVAVTVFDVADPRRRHTPDTLLRRARDLFAQGRVADLQGRPDHAASKGKTAAASVAKAAKLVAAAVRKADRARPASTVVLQPAAQGLYAVHVAPDGPSPVYVGGSPDGSGPLLLRGGAEGFVRIPLPGATTPLDVETVPGGGVWIVGSAGSVFVYEPATGEVAERPVAEQPWALQAVWGSGADDVWAVGSDPDGVGPLSAAFHWDGSAWTNAALPAVAAGRPLSGIWGAAADDVWACGAFGVLHWDGSAWTQDAGVPAGDWSAVHGPDPVVVVGAGEATLDQFPIHERTGGAWRPARVDAWTREHGATTVRVGPGGAAWAASSAGVTRRTPRGWRHVAGFALPAAAEGVEVFVNSLALDASGAAWCAGGRFGGDVTPSGWDDGFLVHHGARPVSGDVLPRAELATTVHTIFTRTDTCSQAACHAPPFLSEGLDLQTLDGLRARLAGVPSRQSNLPLVAPGRPSASYLFRKVEGTHAAVGSGDPMPQGEDALTAEELRAIRAWILEGAPGE